MEHLHQTGASAMQLMRRHPIEVHAAPRADVRKQRSAEPAPLGLALPAIALVPLAQRLLSLTSNTHEQ